MATTTTNFGWDIPQSTDLVKDGATAIAALGQDIDTAFIDLKGGTTGQVLAKASGTDLDFSWVAQDDSNAIQNAIVDAKGDLIAATAADTPARLAVGTDGQVLTADSTAATGLAWATAASGGTWQAWTPTTTNITVGNGTLTARYSKTGKTVSFYFKLLFGSTSSIGASTPSFTLPSTPAATGLNYAWRGGAFDAGTNFYLLHAENDGNIASTRVTKADGTYATGALITSTVPMTWANTDVLTYEGTYEEA
jgi:hypothetical protein